MLSGVVKWFDRKRGCGPAVRGDADRGIVADEKGCFDITSDTAGDRAENISRTTRGYREPAESPGADRGVRERPEWPVQTVLGGDAVDTCPWCVHMREADARSATATMPSGAASGAEAASPPR
ncbi:hypothetical protein AV521_36525 [Streptomyces sp. IMTB 2501]|uniref:hypothetical protein n=1 Tax=Streptomyces sp. IMTB 2501 TaxID=1776340 RepID=UPI00096DB02A|nr:hypothetical protein [Streptomyces sp. IMTB 2501]OLZ64051.1 hypothetical protein AV521_36525 [Streptomyces sp. IMTB 2501]